MPVFKNSLQHLAAFSFIAASLTLHAEEPPLPAGPLIAEAAPATAPGATRPPSGKDKLEKPSEAPQPLAAPAAADAPPAPKPAALLPDLLFDPSGLPIPTEPTTPPPPLPPEEEDETPGMAESLAVNLVKHMVKQGIITPEAGEALFKQAEADVAAAREKRLARRAARQEAEQFAQQTGTGEGTGEKIRVTYVPEVVKQELRQQIKQEILSEAKKELTSTILPEWVEAWHPFVDFRLRYEYDSYPAGNATNGSFPNFNVINTGPPYDTSGVLFAPQINTDQDRQRMRLRLRIGSEIELGDNFTLGVRLGTGDTNSPVSGNQSFGSTNTAPGGAVNTQGGQFAKYAIWLDRAFLKWEPIDSLSFTIGRFDNPFFSSVAIWSEDIGFDGLLLQGRHVFEESGISPFITLGTFPVFNTDLHFASNQPAKFESRDKWLHAVQIGTDWKINKDWHAKAALAYYYFQNIEGKLSTRYIPRNIEDQGDTDHTRPSFAQKGNSYRALRNIDNTTALNGFGATNQFQYYGLASPFRIAAGTFRVDYNGFEPFQVSLMGEYIENLAFNKGATGAVAVNNLANGGFDGGNKAWDLNLRFGTPELHKKGDWFAYVGYTHRESDSVVDGFNDQNFGGGGTNLEGYTLGAALALSPRVNAAVRWMSATQIAGPQYKNDILFFDINAKF